MNTTRKIKLGAATLFGAAGVLIVALAHARSLTHEGSRGERCSTMCPIARQKAEADCEDRGTQYAEKSCHCDERSDPPTAEVVYTCK